MTFAFHQTLDLPREVVFRFFSNPERLNLLHEEQKFVRVLRHGFGIDPGCETWVEVTLFKILPVVLGFRHYLYEQGNRFGERMIHGPFKEFIHIHEFAAIGSGTEIKDWLEIKLPICFGGDWAVRRIVQPILKAAFAVRHAKLQNLAAMGVVKKYGEENL